MSRLRRQQHGLRYQPCVWINSLRASEHAQKENTRNTRNTEHAKCLLHTSVRRMLFDELCSFSINVFLPQHV